jgi:uncharacterized protein YaaN involved in tellurite resistance
MDNNLQKLAADAIKELKSENDTLKSEVERLKTASQMAFDMFNKGSVSAESLEETYQSLLGKDSDELQVLEKAASYGGYNAESLLGSLSEKPADDGTLDPLTRMLVEDL